MAIFELIIGIIIGVIGGRIMGFNNGRIDTNNKWKKETILRGYGHYDSITGEWEWIEK